MLSTSNFERAFSILTSRRIYKAHIYLNFHILICFCPFMQFLITNVGGLSIFFEIVNLDELVVISVRKLIKCGLGGGVRPCI